MSSLNRSGSPSICPNPACGVPLSSAERTSGVCPVCDFVLEMVPQEAVARIDTSRAVAGEPSGPKSESGSPYYCPRCGSDRLVFHRTGGSPRAVDHNRSFCCLNCHQVSVIPANRSVMWLLLCCSVGLGTGSVWATLGAGAEGPSASVFSLWVLTGIFAVITSAVVLPGKASADQLATVRPDRIPCPACGQFQRPPATVCEACGTDFRLPEPAVLLLPECFEARYSRPKALWASVVGGGFFLPPLLFFGIRGDILSVMQPLRREFLPADPVLNAILFWSFLSLLVFAPLVSFLFFFSRLFQRDVRLRIDSVGISGTNVEGRLRPWSEIHSVRMIERGWTVIWEIRGEDGTVTVVSELGAFDIHRAKLFQLATYHLGHDINAPPSGF